MLQISVLRYPHWGTVVLQHRELGGTESFHFVKTKIFLQNPLDLYPMFLDLQSCTLTTRPSMHQCLRQFDYLMNN